MVIDHAKNDSDPAKVKQVHHHLELRHRSDEVRLVTPAHPVKRAFTLDIGILQLGTRRRTISGEK
jgi:hypothetical protein